jgi:hypothetical protein
VDDVTCGRGFVGREGDLMRSIRFNGTLIPTSGDVADAVMERAEALSSGGRSDPIEVPAIAPDGMMTTTKILIGPSSELVIEDADDDELEVDDPRFVARLRSAATTFGHVEPLHATERPAPGETAQ